MTHRACRSRARTGQLTATGPVTSTCLHDRWGRVEATQTALGEALAIRRRTRVRFPPPPPRGLGEMPGPLLAKSRGPPRAAGAPGSSPSRAVARRLVHAKPASATGRGRGGAIDSVLDTVDSFYGEVLQPLKAWTAAPPKMREVAELPDARRPALVSTALSSQDGVEPVDEQSSDDVAELEDELLASSGS